MTAWGPQVKADALLVQVRARPLAGGNIPLLVVDDQVHFVSEVLTAKVSICFAPLLPLCFRLFRTLRLLARATGLNLQALALKGPSNCGGVRLRNFGSLRDVLPTHLRKEERSLKSSGSL